MTPIVIPMEKRCFRSFYTLFEAIAAEGRYFVRTYAPSRRAMKRIVCDAVARDLPFYIALNGRVVTGFSAILFPTLPSLSHSGTLVMGVLPSYRRQGIGGALLDRALSHAFSNPKNLRIQLEVFQDNAAAVSLYEGRGFVSEGVARGAVKLEGGFKDVAHMALFRGTDAQSD